MPEVSETEAVLTNVPENEQVRLALGLHWQVFGVDSQGLARAGESSGGDTDSDDAGSHGLAWKNLTEDVEQ